MENIKLFSSHNVLISENENSDTVEAKFIICDFSPNKNNVSLARATIESWHESLIGKPLVGKVATKADGSKDFTGHNVITTTSTDSNGKKIKKVEFDTSGFGYFNSVGIEEIDSVEYITATATIWKRFTQAYEVFSARASSEEGISTSWEIQSTQSHTENIDGKDIKVIDSGNFIGHAVLGKGIIPAYENSGLLSVASEEVDEFEQALLNDMISISTKEGEENLNTHTSALTSRDLRQKIKNELNKNGYSSNPYYYIWEIFPAENKALAYNEYREFEDDYVAIKYSVEGDTLSITEITPTKLSTLIAEYQMYTPENSQVNISVSLDETAKLLSAKETEIQTLSSKVEELTSEITTKDEKILSATDKIVELQASVDELTPFKAQVEELEQAEKARQDEIKREELKEMATAKGYITKEELESNEEIATMISELDEKGIKMFIAERVIEGYEPVVTSEQKTDSNKENLEGTLNTSSLLDDEIVNPIALMSQLLKK